VCLWRRGFVWNSLVHVCLWWDGVFVCWEGVLFWPSLCGVCVFVLKRLMVWCALCWGIVWPGCLF